VAENDSFPARWPTPTVTWARAYALAGDREKADAELDRLLRRAEEGYVSPLGISLAYHGRGELDTAFEWLERAARELDPTLTVGAWVLIERETRRRPALAASQGAAEDPGLAGCPCELVGFHGHSSTASRRRRP